MCKWDIPFGKADSLKFLGRGVTHVRSHSGWRRSNFEHRSKPPARGYRVQAPPRVPSYVTVTWPGGKNTWVFWLNHGESLSKHSCPCDNALLRNWVTFQETFTMFFTFTKSRDFSLHAQNIRYSASRGIRSQLAVGNLIAPLRASDEYLIAHVCIIRSRTCQCHRRLIWMPRYECTNGEIYIINIMWKGFFEITFLLGIYLKHWIWCSWI